MVKVKIICNHCEDEVEWYPSMINEVGYYGLVTKNPDVDEKFYCEKCIKMIGHEAIDLG